MQEGGKKEERRRTFSPPGNKLEGAEEEEEKCWGGKRVKKHSLLCSVPWAKTTASSFPSERRGKNPFARRRRRRRLDTGAFNKSLGAATSDITIAPLSSLLACGWKGGGAPPGQNRLTLPSRKRSDEGAKSPPPFSLPPERFTDRKEERITAEIPI